MGGGGEDPQKLKKIAAAAYDYENDPKWADYWSNILIPPHMASRSDVVDHYKRKFYQRYVDPGLVVEPMATSSSNQQGKASASQTSSSSTPNDQPRAQSSESSGRTSRTSPAPAPAPAPTSLRWDRQTIQFTVNAWVFIMAVLAIFPLIPTNMSNRAYRLSFIGTACSAVYTLYAQHGVWLQSVIVTKDFIYFIYSLTFVSSSLCLKFALIPILCQGLQYVAKFLRQNFNRTSLYRKYSEEACVWVESNGSTLNILSSQAEIGLGFLLIISLISWQRSILQTFMYWQLLKLMYHVPATSGYHQSAWTKIGSVINPLVRQYAPFLNTPISAVKKWWLRT